MENNTNTQEKDKTLNKTLLVIVVVLAVILSALGAWAYLSYIDDSTQQPDKTNQDINTSVIIDGDQVPEIQQELTPHAIDYDEEDLVYTGDASVYITIYSHNEDSWEAKVNSPAKYYSYREGLIERAEVIADYGIQWNWQTDQPVVDAMAEFEFDDLFKSKYTLSGDADKNVLEYLETLGVHFDPHAHTNNYADIAFIMEEFLGVDATPVIGGLTHVECGHELYGFLDYMSWHEQVDLQPDGYVYGEDFPEAKWKPEILSDPGMGGHYFDDYSSGAWKPGDEDDFYKHYPNSDIVYIGEGYPHDVTVIGAEHASGSAVWSQDGAYIQELVSKIEDGEFPTGLKSGEEFMYTASIHMRDTDVVTEGGGAVNTAEGIATLLDELEPLRDAGKIIFVDFQEAARVWQDEYNSFPHFVSLETFSFYDDLGSEASDFCEAKLAQDAARPKR